MPQRIISVAIVLLAGLAFADRARGQVPQYTPPAGSPLPSQLNHFRFDGLSGLLDNYNGIVVPQQNLNYQLQTMNAQQQSNYRTTQREISQLRASDAAPTGTGAGFMNYSHYYPLRGMGGRAAGGNRSRPSSFGSSSSGYGGGY
jgi:hypothetical protein